MAPPPRPADTTSAQNGHAPPPAGGKPPQPDRAPKVIDTWPEIMLMIVPGTPDAWMSRPVIWTVSPVRVVLKPWLPLGDVTAHNVAGQRDDVVTERVRPLHLPTHVVVGDDRPPERAQQLQ